MDQHSLNGACAYIDDFIEWHSNANSHLNTSIFVEDRFAKCSKEKQQSLCKIFNKLSDEISVDAKFKSNIYNVANELFLELSN